jgi:hypothetical protein
MAASGDFALEAGWPRLCIKLQIKRDVLDGRDKGCLLESTALTGKRR